MPYDLAGSAGGAGDELHDLTAVDRAHFDAEVEHLLSLGASQVVMGEREIALAMLDFAGKLASQ